MRSMTSVEITNPSHFNSIRQKLSSDFGKEFSEKEVMDFLLEFGFQNYEKLVAKLRIKLQDESPTQEQIDRFLSLIIKDSDIDNTSENIDEVLYGS